MYYNIKKTKIKNVFAAADGPDQLLSAGDKIRQREENIP